MATDAMDILEEIRAQQADMANGYDDDPDDVDEDENLEEENDDELSGKNEVKGQRRRREPGVYVPREPSKEAVNLREKYCINNASHIKNPHQSCVCFRCRRSFPAQAVMGKNHVKVEDGKRTLLCPKCGAAAVIVSEPGQTFAHGLAYRLWSEFYTG